MERWGSSGVGVLGTYAYDDRGRRTSLTRGNGTATGYSYDAVSRLSQLTQDLAGTGHDLTLGFSHNPASQIVENTRSNDTYAWAGHYAVDRDYTANGRNQYTAAGAVTPAYDGRGNLTAAGGPTYAYTANNRLATSTGGTYREMMDDSLDRLFRYYDGSANRWLVYDGQSLIAETNSSGTAIARRYVHGPGVDEPLVWYEVSGGTSDRSWLHADERGSVIAISNGSGAVTNINAYDEYGIPGASNAGRFQYTGQQWLSELGMQYSRARIYSPTLGRFLQTDPIGYGGGMNLYAYVGGDPVNLTDPLGLDGEKDCQGLRFDADPHSICVMDPTYTYVDISQIGTGSGTAPGVAGVSSGTSGQRRVFQPTSCQRQKVAAAISPEGLPTDRLSGVVFLEGLDAYAYPQTIAAYSSPGTTAVAQGNRVYVNPDHWNTVTNPNNMVFWEELIHTAQFARYGEIGYYAIYSGLSALSPRNPYHGNALEAQAKTIGRNLAQQNASQGGCR